MDQSKQQTWREAVLPIKQKYAVRLIRRYGTKSTVWDVNVQDEWERCERLAVWLVGERSTRTVERNGKVDEAASVLDNILSEVMSK